MPDISHFQRWFIYWYQDLCARYLSLPALVYILVSGSLCQISLTSSVGLYIGIRLFVPDISHFQRWSIYWCVQVFFAFDGQVSYVLDHRVAGGEDQVCSGPLLFQVDCANSWWSETSFLYWKVEPGGICCFSLAYPLLQEPCCCCFQCGCYSRHGQLVDHEVPVSLWQTAARYRSSFW